MLRRRTARLLLMLLAALSLVIASATSAFAAPPETFTETVHGVTESFHDGEGICGVTGQVTITYNSVFHITAFDDGRIHVTGTTTGKVVIEGDNGVTYTGHFAQWFGENGNNKNVAATFTFSVNLKGDDGSRLKFHVVAHFSTNANGEITSVFEKAHCR